MQLRCKTSGLEPAVLLKMLERALHRQRTLKPCGYKVACKPGVEIGGVERDLTVRWLAHLNQQFKFYPETFSLSVAILDRFLHTVKARPKYLRCIGMACFYLASKTIEEDEVIPGTLELVRESGCGCTVSEVLRMERCILDKLHWNIRYVTYSDFLHIFHAMMLAKTPHLLDRYSQMTPSRQLTILTDKLSAAISHHSLAGFAPATLAAAAVSLELEMCSPNWLAHTVWLQATSQIDSEALIRCREAMNRMLATVRIPTAVYTPLPAPNLGKPIKRKMDDLEEDDIYEGIKRLYNEEDAINMGTCAREAMRDTVTSCALTAVAN